MKRLQHIAWMVVLIVDVGYIAWGAGAAAAPHRLLGPEGKAILPAGYEGYSSGSWAELGRASPLTAGYITLLFRMYGLYCILFGFMGAAVAVTAFRRGEHWAWWALLIGNTVALVSAMTYDKTVNAIGPFELTEYLGLGLVWAALGVTAPFGATAPPLRAT